MKDIKFSGLAVLTVFLVIYWPMTVKAASAELLFSLGVPPFYWVIAIVGGSIAITLTYVSWRKYKAEKKKQSDKHSNN